MLRLNVDSEDQLDVELLVNACVLLLDDEDELDEEDFDEVDDELELLVIHWVLDEDFVTQLLELELLVIHWVLVELDELDVITLVLTDDRDLVLVDELELNEDDVTDACVLELELKSVTVSP